MEKASPPLLVTTTVLYIIPHKIQKRRLQDMKTSARKKGFSFEDTVGPQVTHIVAECDNLDQAMKMLPEGEKEAISDSVQFVSLRWFIECLKNSSIVPIQDSHRLKKIVDVPSPKNESQGIEMAEWACQRIARLSHKNKKFTAALEVLEEHATLRDGAQDYSRALAFRRASCVLKSMELELKNIQQLDGLKDIGEHVRRVIMDILDHGCSDEAEEIAHSSWFKTMKVFTAVFGVGSATAKKWIEMGLATIEDVKRAGSLTSDWRVQWGLAFHKELTSPVLRQEGLSFLKIVEDEAQKILPGIIVELCGGFRRGKQTGHDVDILLTHPKEGAELGILSKLLKVLEEKGLILIGHKERGNFRPEVLYQDFKLSARGQLDHFEKWLGICKFPKSFQDNTESTIPVPQNKNSVEKSIRTACDDGISNTTDETALNVTNSFDESLEEGNYEPAIKKSRFKSNEKEEPEVVANRDRDWLARRVDLIVAPYSQFYYALVGWTGSKHFNRDARLYAQKVLGLKLTSHGLYDLAKNSPIPATSEQEVFDHLKLPYRPPEDRNC